MQNILLLVHFYHEILWFLLHLVYITLKFVTNMDVFAYGAIFVNFHAESEDFPLTAGGFCDKFSIYKGNDEDTHFW